MARTSKYDPLTAFLCRQQSDEITISFEDIESARLIGVKLPDSARVYRRWWSNEVRADARQCRAWVRVAWDVAAVNLGRKVVTFRRRNDMRSRPGRLSSEPCGGQDNVAGGGITRSAISLTTACISAEST